MPVNTSSGCKIYIGSNALVQPDPTLDTYTEIGFVANAGAFGRQYSEITFDDLGNRNTLKFKGQRNDGTMPLQLGRDTSDPGQAAMIVALDNDNDFNFKVELNDSSDTSGAVNTTFLFQAKVMSYTTNIGGPNQVVGSNGNLAIKSGSIQETPPT